MFFFFFNDTATTEIYTLSLHDALPIYEGVVSAAAAALEDGKFKTPTLRNIALTAPYMHNGVHATLKDVIQHYDIDMPNRYVEPEVIPNIATEIEFDTLVVLGLSPQDYIDLEAFMNTLTDGIGSCF